MIHGIRTEQTDRSVFAEIDYLNKKQLRKSAETYKDRDGDVITAVCP